MTRSHIGRVSPLPQLQWVDIDHDRRYCHVGGWKRDPAPGQLLAQAIDSVVVKLLLIEVVGGQAELQNRNADALYCTTIGGWIPAGMSARIAFVAETIWRWRGRGHIRLK